MILNVMGEVVASVLEPLAWLQLWVQTSYAEDAPRWTAVNLGVYQKNLQICINSQDFELKGWWSIEGIHLMEV